MLSCRLVFCVVLIGMMFEVGVVLGGEMFVGSGVMGF